MTESGSAKPRASTDTMRTCGSNETSRSRTRSKNPFITDSTTISAATPSPTPAIEIPVMTEISDTRLGLTRYRRAMKLR